jgi:hypothetical protein
VFADVTNDMIIARQENLRPVLVAIPLGCQGAWHIR